MYTAAAANSSFLHIIATDVTDDDGRCDSSDNFWYRHRCAAVVVFVIRYRESNLGERLDLPIGGRE